MLVSDLFPIEEDIESRVQERETKIKRDYFPQQWKTTFYSLFDTFKMNDRTALMSASVLGECCGFPFSQRILLRCQILRYGVVKFGIVDNAADPVPIFHLGDDCNFVRAGQ